jgi:glutaredoxin
MSSLRRVGKLGIVIALATASCVFFGCRRSAPDVPVVAQPLSDLQVLKDGRFLFTYVESSGAFATTDKPDIIPEPSRKMVRVIDPGQTKSRELTNVYTVNVMDLLKSGKATARPLAREAFETAAIAQLPPGESSALAAGPRSPAASHPAGPADAGVFASPAGKPVVTIYGTSWCGACRTARQYFSERKIPFADKDVEQDPTAARELAEKAARMGIPTDRVPILEVRGRLLLGFDRARVEALLGEST